LPQLSLVGFLDAKPYANPYCRFSCHSTLHSPQARIPGFCQCPLQFQIAGCRGERAGCRARSLLSSPQMKKPYRIAEDQAPKIVDWLASGRGVAIWQNVDLGSASIGGLAFTPAITDGARTNCPGWQYGREPLDVSHAREDFIVEFTAPGAIVKVRRGPPCYGGIHRRDRAKLDKAMELAGKGSFWTYSEPAGYGSPWFGVRVHSIVGTRPL